MDKDSLSPGTPAIFSKQIRRLTHRRSCKELISVRYESKLHTSTNWLRSRFQRCNRTLDQNLQKWHALQPPAAYILNQEKHTSPHELNGDVCQPIDHSSGWFVRDFNRGQLFTSPNRMRQTFFANLWRRFWYKCRRIRKRVVRCTVNSRKSYPELRYPQRKRKSCHFATQQVSVKQSSRHASTGNQLDFKNYVSSSVERTQTKQTRKVHGFKKSDAFTTSHPKRKVRGYLTVPIRWVQRCQQ